MEWENPPDTSPRTGPNANRFRVEAAALAAHPRKWGLLAFWPTDHTNKDKQSARAIATNVNKGRYSAFRPAGAFQATARVHPDGTLKVHARYLGGGKRGSA